jgi:hypothetical protein
MPSDSKKKRDQKKKDQQKARQNGGIKKTNGEQNGDEPVELSAEGIQIHKYLCAICTPDIISIKFPTLGASIFAIAPFFS